VTAAQAPTTGGQALAAFDGGVQVLGATLFIVGYLAPKKYVTWQGKMASVSVLPMIGSLGTQPKHSATEAPVTAGLTVTVTNL
jgi:hypothetical protein